jgi:hypothetical protein
MPTQRDEGLKKTTIRFPEALHRWYRHRAVDNNTHFEAAVIAALADWAAARGFDTRTSGSSQERLTTGAEALRLAAG